MPRTSTRILLVEDDTFLADLTRSALAHEFDVTIAHTVRAALEAVGRKMPNLVLLDLNLPDEDGLVCARHLRARSPTLPIVYLTARATRDDMLTGLEIGGDDYVTKPFDTDILVARIRAVLRRSGQAQDAALWKEFGAAEARFRMSSGLREVRLMDGTSVSLTRAEFDILASLADAGGRVQSRDHLLDVIATRPDHEVDARLVDALVSKVRRKMLAAGLSSTPIQTIRGLGYRLAAV